MIKLDPSDIVAIRERATYLSTLHGRGGGRWHYSSKDRLFEDHIERNGRISDYLLERLTEEVPAEVVARDIELPDPPNMASGCGGKGYHWVYDTDYPCSGCYACRAHRDPMVIVAWWVGVMVWALATSRVRADLRQGVRGMQALASIGAVFGAIGDTLNGPSTFLCAMVQEWNTVRVGRWYRVTGKRGKAKGHHGAEGEVMRLEHAAGRYGSVGTLRAALKLPGESKWAWVPASTLEPAHEPEERVRAKRAEEEIATVRAARPPYAGSKGDIAYIVDGPSAGKHGTVIWTGTGKGGVARVGVKIGPAKEDVAWADALDVSASLADATAVIAGPGTEVDAALIDAVAGGDDEARLALGDLAEVRGHAKLGIAWRAPAPFVQPPPEPKPRRARTRRRRAA